MIRINGASKLANMIRDHLNTQVHVEVSDHVLRDAACTVQEVYAALDGSDEGIHVHRLSGAAVFSRHAPTRG